MTEKNVYLVRRHTGEYSDYRTWPVVAMEDEEKANEYAKMCQELSDELDQKIRSMEEKEDFYDNPKYEKRIAKMKNKYDPEFDFSMYDNNITYDVVPVLWK